MARKPGTILGARLPGVMLAADETVTVDREAGIIRNIAILTIGQTKPSANGLATFDVDATSLQQTADAINAAGVDIGVKSRMTHPEIEGADDLPHRLGYVRNAKVVGESVRGDMHFHDSESTYAIMLMDIADNDPTSCGLSILSETATLEPSAAASTGMVLRVSAIEAVDWVGCPAGNPAGMLSAKRFTSGPIILGETIMTQAQKDFLHAQGLPWDATDEQTAAFIEALSEDQKAQFAALKDSAAVESAAEAATAAGEAAAPATPATPVETEVAAAEGEEEEEVPAEEKEKPAVAAGARRRVPVGNGRGAALSRATLRAEMAAERQRERARAAEIRSIALRCDLGDDWAKQHIDAETSIGEVRRIALKAIKRAPGNMVSTRVSVGADLNRDSLDAAIQDAIMLRAGTRSFVRFDEQGVALSADRRPVTRQPHERANHFRGHSVLEMGRRYLIALGYHQADAMGKPALAELLMSRSALAAKLPGVYLAHATGDFPHLLADAMGKVLRAEYALAPATWQLWCNRTTAPDFKDIKKIQLSEAADLVEIHEDDEYEYGTLSESKEVYALSTYGKGLKFSRRMLINDDLSAFDRVPRMMGQAAARKVEGLAIAILTANAALADSVALFATGHANLTTGVLSVASLGAARAAMRKQTALGSSDPLELMPRLLIVPEALFITASQLVSSAVDPAKSNATPNPFANQLQVISSPRLDTDSAAKWYLSASPSDIDTVDVCFLEGQEAPVVMEEDEFDTDARKVKVRQECAAKAIDYRGLVRSSGA